MFGTTACKPAKPPPPKSKEDILSLFEQPHVPLSQPASKPDLLHDDLDETIGEGEPPEQEEPDTEQSNEISSRDEPVFTSLLIRPDESTHDITSQPQAATGLERQVNNMAAPSGTASTQRATTPDIEITTVEDLPRSDDEDEPEAMQEPETETKPQIEPDTEPEIVSEHSPPTERLVTQAALVDGELIAAEPEPEEMDTGLDFPLASSGQLSANPFASPDEEEPNFAPMPAAVANIFAVNDPDSQMETPKAPSHTANIFASDPDEFDAFSAKFDSVKKDNISIMDGFGGSGAITPTGGDGKFYLSKSKIRFRFNNKDRK